LFAHCWVQVPIGDDARQFEEEVDEDGNKFMTGRHDPTGNLMCKYHVDCHPGFFQSIAYSMIIKCLAVICLCICQLIVIQKLLLVKMNVTSRRTCFHQNSGQQDLEKCPLSNYDDGWGWISMCGVIKNSKNAMACHTQKAVSFLCMSTYSNTLLAWKLLLIKVSLTNPLWESWQFFVPILSPFCPWFCPQMTALGTKRDKIGDKNWGQNSLRLAVSSFCI